MNTTQTTATDVRNLLALGTARAMADGHGFDVAMRLAVQAMAETNPEAMRVLATAL
jgi:S-formylglutathione hydrolase FrmB